MPSRSSRRELRVEVVSAWGRHILDPTAFARAVARIQHTEEADGTDLYAVLTILLRQGVISPAAAQMAMDGLQYSPRQWRERTRSPPSRSLRGPLTNDGRARLHVISNNTNFRQYSSNNGSNRRSNDGSNRRSNDGSNRRSNDGSDRRLILNNIPYGISMPSVPRENLVTMEDVPFEQQVYLLDDVDDSGQLRRVYALSTLTSLRNGRNPMTRKPFGRANIRRVS